MKSHRLTYRDLRNVADLVDEVAEVGWDPSQWRPHLLEGAMRLTNSQIGLTVDMLGLGGSSPPQLVELIDLGWSTESSRKTFFQYLADPAFIEDPGALALASKSQSGRLVTAYREQWIDSPAWYAAPAVSELRRSAHIDCFLCSILNHGGGAISGFVVYRPWGGKPFNGRDRRVARLLHAHIARLIRQGTADPLLRGVAGLPARAKQTLAAVAEGSSDKVIADQLGISTHTVRDYMKAIFAATGLSSRSEVIAAMHRPRQKRGVLQPTALGG